MHFHSFWWWCSACLPWNVLLVHWGGLAAQKPDGKVGDNVDEDIVIGFKSLRVCLILGLVNLRFPVECWSASPALLTPAEWEGMLSPLPLQTRKHDPRVHSGRLLVSWSSFVVLSLHWAHFSSLHICSISEQIMRKSPFGNKLFPWCSRCIHVHQKFRYGRLPGGPVAKTRCFPCRGSGFDPCLGS